MAALGGLFQAKAMLLMLGGVVISSIFAALPGIGSLLFLSMTIPFAMTLEPYECIALLLGIATVSNTANTFSSVLIAVPGGAGSQATILDGYPMAQKGEANRAFGAAYAASALGALFGAIVFTATLPVMRPMVMGFGSPAFLMLVIWGLSAVAVLGGNQPLKGLLACVLGLAITTIGAEQRTGVERFVLEEGDYLSEGIHIIVVALGLFAVPELISLSVRRTSVSQTGELGSGLMQGVRDAFRHWWLIIRCSTIGVWIGVLPGLGSSVADWFAYAHTVQSEKNKENFGKGDVRGVIGPESSNNAKEGGALIPTTFFGIPGSTSFALILVAFIAVGITPGKEMMTSQLHYLYAMIVVLVVANLFATSIALAFSNTFAKASLLPYYVIVPMTLVLCSVAAFNVSNQVQDLAAFLTFSVIGFFMKRYGWPRPPVLVAVVLGPQLQAYLWLTTDLHGWSWVTHLDVLVIFAIIVLTVLFPIFRRRKGGGKAADVDIVTEPPKGPGAMIFTGLFIVVLGLGVYKATDWPLFASLGVFVIGGVGLALALPQLLLDARKFLAERGGAVSPEFARRGQRERLAAAWILGLVGGAWLFGFHAAFALFPLLYVRAHGGSWRMAVILSALALAVLIIVFDSLVHVLWPEPLVLEWLGIEL
ncbi:MAG: tripartite tricarboxylate transporter permease [Alphaproteobacteria bacterium]|nr:tripartite tricarboxylate transporter permease [Alphaproteobacteria bacterium]